MRIRNQGKVCERLWYLGHEESGVYLLEGTVESMIISGGMSYIVPSVLKQIEDFGINREKISKLLILHAHFDHVGIVPYFKRTQPDLEVYASERGWEIIGMAKAKKTINAFSRSVSERMGSIWIYDSHDLDWRDDITGTVVHEGDVIDLGEMEVKIIETPGHSSCSISAYVPRIKALFPSDGGGIPYGHGILTSGNSNFTKFQESLEKLKTLETDYLCADHYGYVKGDEAKSFIKQSILSARGQRRVMEESYLRTGDIDSAAKELVDAFYAENPDYFLSREIFEGVYRQMVKHLAGAMKAQG